MIVPERPVRLNEANPELGRIQIFTDEKEVTPNNVIDVLSAAMTVHMVNQRRIEYLWDYYRGRQPVLDRKKEVREEINNKVVENVAAEIVDFHTGYLLSEPIQYVGKKDDMKISEAITVLNDWMDDAGKESSDSAVSEWFHIAGVGYRMALPNPDEDEDCPFRIFDLDPRYTLIVRNSGLGHKPVMGVQYVVQQDGTLIYTCYTPMWKYEIEGDKLVSTDPNPIGMIPIIEYPLNNARQGVFEKVLPLCDALNALTSNRMDSVEQFVQAFFKFINCEIDSDDFEEFKRMGAIKIKSVNGQNADVQLITSELNQTQTQTLKGDLYQSILNICSMPNRNGGSSTSDTGAAVTMRDGWSAAETRAKRTEKMFRKSEKMFLKLILKICEAIDDLGITVGDIKESFTRRNYCDIQTKSQVLTTMLANPKIHPRLAFESCGMFVDPEAAYVESDAYYQKMMEELQNQQIVNAEDDEDDESEETEGSLPNSGSPAGESKESSDR